MNLTTGVVNEKALGQVATFPRKNRNIEVPNETVHSRRQGIGKVSSIVNQNNKYFVINTILFINVFARCSDMIFVHLFFF